MQTGPEFVCYGQVSGIVSDAPRDTAADSERVSLREATLVWAKIGLLSFGGPTGQIALMHRILVEEKQWISESRFLHALNFCMLLPGPEAQQLATYVGWMLHRMRGGLIAGTLFVLPGFLVVLALSYLYVKSANLPIVTGLFAGMKAAVVVIVLQAVIRIGRRSLRSAAAVTMAIIAFLAMYAWRVPFPWVILFAAIAGALLSRYFGDTADSGSDDTELDHPAGAAYVSRCIGIFGALWLVPTFGLLAALGPDHVFPAIAAFFSKMAIVSFGGAYAVLAYVSQEAVVTYQWLAPGEMIDGLALAETTPGPLILVTEFVGYVAAWRNHGALSPEPAAFLGAALATWVTFVPSFLWIFAGAPYIERLRRNRMLASALAAVTAAVVGVIVNLALWFSMHALFDGMTQYHIAGAVLDVPILTSFRTSSVLLTLTAAVLAFRLGASLLTTLAVTGALGIATYVF